MREPVKDSTPTNAVPERYRNGTGSADRLGELLKEMPKNEGGRPKETGSAVVPVSSTPTRLGELLKEMSKNTGAAAGGNKDGSRGTYTELRDSTLHHQTPPAGRREKMANPIPTLDSLTARWSELMALVRSCGDEIPPAELLDEVERLAVEFGAASQRFRAANPNVRDVVIARRSYPDGAAVNSKAYRHGDLEVFDDM